MIAHPAATGEDDIRLAAVLKDGAALAPAVLLEWLRERLPRFLLPRCIEIVSSLPRTGTGKVEKLRLVQQGYGAGLWDAQCMGSGVQRRVGEAFYFW